MSIFNTSELKDSDRDNMVKVINYLEKHSFLMETRVNISTLAMEEVPEHELCRKYESEIRDYFSFRGADLIMTNADFTYYLSGELMRPITPSPTIIKILLLVKSFFDENSSKLNFRDNYFTKKSLREKGYTTGLITDKITDGTWNEALSFMKTHNLITYQGCAGEIADDDKIYIYPTIAIYINPTIVHSIKEMIAALSSDINNNESVSTIDSKLEEVTDEK